MKKLLFLISVCLLSQNFTIASENLGDNVSNIPPVPLQSKKNLIAPVPNKPAPIAIFASAASSTVPVPQKQITENNPVPSPTKQPSQSIPKVQETKAQKSLDDKNIQPKQIPAVNKVVKKAAPPVPKSLEDLKQEYRQAVDEQEKYKLYESAKEQRAADGDTKFNLWADIKTDLKNKKNNRPPVIVETLSNPENSTDVRAVITRVEFSPSKVFTDEELQQLASPLLSQPVTITDIKKVVDGITRCYILGDYPTSKAYLPPQTITKEGILKIGLFEGPVGKVIVDGNRWTKSSYIEKRVAPKEGELFRLGDLEKDVIKFNNNNQVKLRVGLNAGEQQGETDIVLNTEDPFPFHIAFMTDNQGRQTIGTTRWGGMLAADSLFGHRDRLSLGGYLGRGNRVGFADYNIPVGRFGTRIGASVSAGNISVVSGALRPFGIGGTSQVYSLYATQPLFDRQDANITSYTAANLKHSTTDISGLKISDINTFSLTQGFTGRKDTEKGIWYTGHYGSIGFKALGGDEDFLKYEGNITRLHDFGKGIIGQFRISGQYSPNDRLPWLEQFQIGGLSTVRGYSEGLLLGKSGYFASAEILTPIPILPKRIGSDKLGYIYPREMVKGAVFMDNGMVFPYKGGASIDGGELLMSWGWGLRVNLKKDLAARFYWGYGLNNKYEADQKMGRFHFEITCAPDIGRLVADRKPVQKKSKKKKNKETL